MTIAVLCTMGASFLLAITNHFDKFMVNDFEDDSSIKALLIFSTLIASIILFPISLLINNFSINFDLLIFLITFISAFMFAFSSYFYFQALKITDASIVVALFQIVPVFSLILTFIFFHEILTIKQLIGILIIIIAAMVMSLKKNQGIFNFIPFIYMLIVTISSAIYYFTLEIAIKLSNYSNALVLFQLSLFIIGIILMFIKSYRLSFFHMLDYQKKLVGFNFLNETLTLIANILNNFANTLIPLAIVNALSSFQIVFTFLIGIVGSLIIPKLFYEQIDKKTIIKKITCIGLELFGVYLMTI